VDPDNQIAEADEGDNLTYQSLHLLPHDAIVAYPNPFDAGRTHHLSFSGVPLFSRVEISTATGEPVWRGREEEQGSLSREILWSGRNRAGFPVAGGVYVYTVTSFEGEVLQRDKIAVIR